MIDLGISEVFWSGLLVVLALIVSFWWRIPVQKDMALGSVRAFVQLIAIGYALKYIFELDSPWLILAAIAVMIVVGAQAAGSRSKEIKGVFVVALIAMSVGSAVTIGVMILLKIITFEPRYVIPLAGMIVGNSMNAAALTVNRLSSDIRQNSAAIEASLALGKSWRQASRDLQRDAAVAGMIPILNFMKTVGLVALPGAMTGMILAGVEPIKAILLQIIVAFMLLSAVTLTSVTALELTIRKFFTIHHQLVLPTKLKK